MKKLYKASLSTICRNPNNIIPVNTSAPDPPQPITNSTMTTIVKPASSSLQILPGSAEMIPIEFEPQRLLIPQNHNAESGNVSVQVSKFKKQETMTDKFSNYISRVKNRMRSSASDVGGANISSGSDNLDDNVSSFLGRAKMKMKRTTSRAVSEDQIY